MGIYDYQLNPLVDEHFVAINSEIRIEKNNTAIIGSGAIKFIDELDKDKELKHSKSALYAKDLLWEALQKWARNDYVDLTSYEPNYIKSVFVTKPKSKF
jgi:tRNA A37 threonylcarbamoyladenosine modification protein TsaB